MLRYVKEISYLKRTLMFNVITYIFVNIISYEPQVPWIDNEWEYFSSKYGEVFLNNITTVLQIRQSRDMYRNK